MHYKSECAFLLQVNISELSKFNSFKKRQFFNIINQIKVGRIPSSQERSLTWNCPYCSAYTFFDHFKPWIRPNNSLDPSRNFVILNRGLSKAWESFLESKSRLPIPQFYWCIVSKLNVSIHYIWNMHNCRYYYVKVCSGNLKRNLSGKKFKEGNFNQIVRMFSI